MAERNDRLKPCPSCGRKPLLYRDMHAVMCGYYFCDGRATVTFYNTDEDAIEAWNRWADSENGRE